MRITKKELLRRVHSLDVCLRRSMDEQRAAEAGAFAAARALGFEVSDEAELPERLSCVTNDGEAVAPAWVIGAVESESPGGGGTMRPLFALGVYRSATKDEASAVLQEWLRRYNAKAEVLKVADELGRGCRFADAVDFARMERSLRAAYGELDTTAGVVSAVAQGLGDPTMKSGGQRVPGR